MPGKSKISSTHDIAFETKSGSWSDKVTIKNNGNVGIGTSAPAYPLHISKSINGELHFLVQNTYGIGNRTFLSTSPDRSIIYTDRDFSIGTNSNNWSEKLTVVKNGNVGIGTTTPAHKLTVAGTVGAREVTVDANMGADFVFAPDYHLRPLSEVEQFITENKHLPEIAPAEEMVQNGVNMGEFQIQLLQKIEELTLYVIEQQKQIRQQEEFLNALRQEIETLKGGTNEN